MNEVFDPSRPEYKSAHDLPPEFQDEFRDLQEGGFVRRSAQQHQLELERMVEENNRKRKFLQKLFHQDATRSIDLANQEAIDIDQRLDRESIDHLTIDRITGRRMFLPQILKTARQVKEYAKLLSVEEKLFYLELLGRQSDKPVTSPKNGLAVPLATLKSDLEWRELVSNDYNVLNFEQAKYPRMFDTMLTSIFDKQLSERRDKSKPLKILELAAGNSIKASNKHRGHPWLSRGVKIQYGDDVDVTVSDYEDIVPWFEKDVYGISAINNVDIESTFDPWRKSNPFTGQEFDIIFMRCYPADIRLETLEQIHQLLAPNGIFINGGITQPDILLHYFWSKTMAHPYVFRDVIGRSLERSTNGQVNIIDNIETHALTAYELVQLFGSSKELGPSPSSEVGANLRPFFESSTIEQK